MIVIAPQGTRDLHAAFLRLALTVNETEKPKALWTNAPSISYARIIEDWHRFIRVVQPSVAKDLSLVALAGDIVVVEPRSLRSEALEREAREYLPTFGSARPSDTRSSAAPTPKFFEICKVLLASWLRNEPPLSANEIGYRASASAPTLRFALARLRARGEISDTRNRPIALRGFPRATMRELLALSDNFRTPLHFVDTSGRPPDSTWLLRRIGEVQPLGVALGGVVAARSYDPHFDLNGVPRLDLVMSRSQPIDWVKEVNPALQPAASMVPSPTLVIHPVEHFWVGRQPHLAHSLPIADPVEILLDLYELRLTDQAEHFIAAVRAQEAAR